MKNRSRKAKSTKLQNLVRAKVLKAFPHLRKKDVDTAKEGQSGPDLLKGVGYLLGSIPDDFKN
jgi:hypothetical protein